MKASYDVRNGKPPSETNNEQHISQFRRFAPQIVASTVKNFLLLDLGLSVAFPGIIIPALTGILNENNKNEILSITPAQASWLGSIAYICQPIGSIVSGWLTDPIGRKRAMFIVNIPHVIAWFMMYHATNVWMIFVANILFGLGVGLMEAPIITYVGEICEPSIRGILTACANISVTLGFFIVYFFNTHMPWREVGLICFFVPLSTMIAVCFIPETPLWLLSKNRTEEAQKSLQWLRGWVTKEAVTKEFEQLQRYSERSKSCNLCIKQNQICSHQKHVTMKMKLAELIRKRTLKPFFIVMALFFLAQFSGIAAMRPYIVQVFKAYQTPIEPDQATVLLSVIGNIANVIFIGCIRFTGKRKVCLLGLIGTFISSLVVSAYGFTCLPLGYTSFDQKHQTITLENETLRYIPIIFIMSWAFFSYCGVSSIPWMLLSEIFPFKARGMAAGISAASNYILAFIATKTYYNFEIWFSLPGVTLFYSIISAIGFLIMFKILPETENRTLEDIELHFSDNLRKITDRKIAKTGKNLKLNDDSNKKSVISISGNLNEMTDTSKQITFKVQDGCDNKGFVMEATNR